jgi:CarD family transcriptional regulator
LVKKVAEETFRPGDMVVYPGHGVGKINALLAKNISGTEQQFFEIVICDSGMRIMIPVVQAKTVGLRKVVDRRAVEKVYKILRERKARIDTQTWNRRFREYSQKIKTGSVYEIAEVLRDLSVLSVDKELSFGEKKMLDTAQNLLVSEIAIAKARTHEKVMGEIQAIFS